MRDWTKAKPHYNYRQQSAAQHNQQQQQQQQQQQHEMKPDNFHVNAKICRLVSKYPCMYDRSNPQYLKKDVVDEAWVKIAKEMDDSIGSCKERWRNIRTSFARSINVNKVPASANRTKPYYLHAQLQFLAKHITPGIPVSRRSNASVFYSAADEENETVDASNASGGTNNSSDALHVGDDEDDDDGDGDADGDEDAVSDDEDSCGESQDIKMESSIHEESQPAVQQMPKLQPKRRATTSTAPPPLQHNHHSGANEQQDLAAPNEDGGLELAVPPKKRQRTTELVLSSASSLADIEQESVEIKPTTIEANPEADFDAIFLQGLLPEMKAMDFRQKILFKRRIYEFIAEVFDATLPTPTSSNKVLPTATVPSITNITNANDSKNSVIAPHPIKQGRLVTAHLVTPSAASVPAIAPSTSAPTTIQMVSASDLAMIRRLNSLLQNPVAATIAPINNGIHAPMAATGIYNSFVPVSSCGTATKNASPSVDGQLRSAAANMNNTATVTVNRGALTCSPNGPRNLMRVTMVNAPSLAVATSATAAANIQNSSASTATPTTVLANVQQQYDAVATAPSPAITANAKKSVTTNGHDNGGSDGNTVVKQEPNTVDD